MTGDCCPLKTIVVDIQENGIIRLQSGLLIGTLTKDFSYDDIPDDNVVRLDYLRRLVEGVESMIEQEMNKNPVREEYPDAISATWIDSELLCRVVKKAIFGMIDD